ncbi:Hop family adhesin LabA [Helicobacter pylori]|uniref:Hop family adhesin LabA n=1 Tax=Helicobacter pylori TaxID=210 RepID=UPI0012E8804F|nr:Hop family adhesin LabA [Helicobacter pylori]MUU54904.1 Hop family adhesin LabA [Helicobacter pylori]WQV77618.1 Hop family adhesin LabA [Helicobacter pylori]
MKKKFLSLTLGSLLVSALSAEDNGFFVSAGYQIGESAQMVKNTKGIQDLSDSYERLNNLLTNYSVLNTLIRQSADPNAINNARGNLNASAKNLINDKKNSPAYQAVLLALNAAAGLWQVMSYAISVCGPGSDKNKNGGVQTFENVPSNGGTTITCDSFYEPGKWSGISTENYAKINKAYQIIQKAFGASGQEIPALSDTKELNFEIKGKKNDSVVPGERWKFPWTNGFVSVKWVNGEYKEIKEDIKVSNNAQELLKQASTILTTLNEACPWLSNGGAGGTGGGNSLWAGIDKGDGSACGIFKNEISAIQDMIKNAAIAVEQSKIVAANAQNQHNLDTGKTFNPYKDANFAQSMFANARAQAEILNRAQQVVKDFERIPAAFVKDSLGVCHEKGSDGNLRGTPSGTVTSNTWGAGCAYVGETVTNLKDSIAHFGDQAERIHNARNLAYTLANFSSQYQKLGEHYDSITAAISSLPDAQSLQNVVSKKTNPNSPQGIQDNYYIDSNIHSQVQSRSQELGSNPFRRAGLIAASTTNNGAMNGIGFQVGYKQFFGKNKRWGARYYGFVDYNHTYNKSQFFNASSDVWTYGVGSDLLVNFINDKATKNNKISFGAFGGIALGGTSWLNSQYVNLANVNNYYKAKINTSNFQFLFNLGLRTNLARNKRRGADHSAQHGMELGVKIPTINTNYYSLLGTTLQYRRLYSVYLNYVFAY